MSMLDGSPYAFASDAIEDAVRADLRRLDDRVGLLREQGTLTPTTLTRYYGSTRMEQVAESNALEGSTLSVGETEAAVLRGTTLTGHDPEFVRDAQSLNRAFERLARLARNDSPTDLSCVHEVNSIILDGRPRAGEIRDERVRISGAAHQPPKTFAQVDRAMRDWEDWSVRHRTAHPVLRAIVLHCWLTHVHPYLDGNGRTARAIATLELVKGGYPPAIIKRKDRTRYLNSLAQSDESDLRDFAELFIEKVDGGLIGLENAAREGQEYDPVVARLVRTQRRRLEVWNTAVDLLVGLVNVRLEEMTERFGPYEDLVRTRDYSGLALEQYLELCEGRPISNSWSVEYQIRLPAIGPVERLLWTGFRSSDLAAGIAATANGTRSQPSLNWSEPTGGYPRWRRLPTGVGDCVEMTTSPDDGDDWHVLNKDGQVGRSTTGDLARRIASGLLDCLQ